MIFNSYQFILGFLPATYLGFLLADRYGGRSAAINFLAVASLAFFGMFGLPVLAVLLGSIAFNYSAGRKIAACGENRAAAKRLLILSITANLALLGYLKYTNFFIDVVNQLTGAGIQPVHLMLSIGVSFFTFIQIGYLIDAYNGQLLPANFGRYVVFAAFFPCVTAGPLVLQREVMVQLGEKGENAFDSRRLATGLTMFGMGLFKKVALADAIATYADSVFGAAAGGAAVHQSVAWAGALCYALQLYFDFSGYSDMAIGLAFVFGIRLPINFDSPFKATNISDFWRRWHMTMTRFFTNYVYSGLAMRGMRKAMGQGGGAKYRFLQAAAVPSIVTFLVAGVWHGAGYNFVVYGLLHGCAIATCLAWREFSTLRLPAVVNWLLTMLVVVTGLVIFKAPDMHTAGSLLASMAGLGGDAMQSVPGFDLGRAVSWIVLLGAIVLLLPNTQQILHKDWLSSDTKPSNIAADAGLLAWRPAVTGALAMGGAFAVALTSIGAGTGFLYYQF